MSYEWKKIRAPFIDRKSREELRDELNAHVIRGIVKVKDEIYKYVSGTNTYTLLHIPYISSAEDVTLDGYLNGQMHLFIYGYDYSVSGRDIIWNTAANVPDNQTNVYVTYYYQGTKSGWSDEGQGSLVYTMDEAIGNALDDAYDEMEFVKYMHDVATATGEYLEAKGNLVGCKRIDPIKAIGNLNLTFTTTVTPGNPCTIASGNSFATISTASIAAIMFEAITGSSFTSGTTGIIGIQAVTAGRSGIVGANTITVIESPVTNLKSVTNSNATSGGSDKESDDDYRSRIPLAIESKGKATDNAFIYELSKVTGVDQIKTFNNYRGKGTADIWVIADTLPMSAEVKTKVTNAIESGRAMGTDIILKEPKVINIWMSGSVRRLPTSDSGQVYTWLSGETVSYFDGLGLGERIRTQQLFGNLTKDGDIVDIIDWKINETGSGLVTLYCNADEVFRLGCRASQTGSALSVFSMMESISCTGNYQTGWSVLLGKDTYDSGLSVYAKGIYEITAVYDSGNNVIPSTNYVLDTGASFAGISNWHYLRFLTGCANYPSNGTPFSVGYKYMAVKWDVTTTGNY